MSFSFQTAGSPKDVMAEAARQTAAQPQIPNLFGHAIKEQLRALPADAEVTLLCHGHTGWLENQTSGQISLVMTLDVRLAQLEAAEEAAPESPA